MIKIMVKMACIEPFLGCLMGVMCRLSHNE